MIDLSQRYEKPVLAVATNLWVDIHAPMEVVFSFLSDERELSRWWCSKATSEPRPGGRLHFVWRGDTEITGDALFRRFEPPNHLVIEWTHHNGDLIVCDGNGHRGMAWPPLNIYDLTMINGNTTRLHLHDLGIGNAPAYEALRKATATGWIECAERLKKVIENRQREEATLQARKGRHPAK